MRDPGLVAAAVAKVLDVKEAGERPLLDSVRAHLRDRQLLLLLDNFEQVAEAAPLVAELLAAAPRLTVLATSRAALRLSGEREYPVPPLALPDPRHLPAPGQLGRYAAVRLFVERAQAVKPDFRLTNENAPAIAAICHRLDGLPLAIELAAARVRLLPPQAMLARLERRLPLLTGGARDRPERQQTLRGAIDWSYRLLEPGEQQLFARLAVFAGGATLEAIAAVCEAAGGPAIDVLAGVESLVAKSLLRQTEGLEEEPRFALLETIREYALEHLAESGEAETIGRAQAEYCLGLAEDWERGLRGVGQTVAMQRERLGRLAAELANLRAALAWALERDADLALRLCSPLAYFWHVNGNHADGGRWLARALALPGAAEQPAYADALFKNATRLWLHGDIAAARQQLERVVAFLRAGPGHERRSDLLGRALGYLAAVAVAQEGPDAARALAEEAQVLLRTAGDEPGLAEVLLALGMAHAFRGEHAAARPLLEECLVLVRRRGNGMTVMIVTATLADVLRIEGDAAGAARLYEESLPQHRELGARGEFPGVLHGFGHAVLAQGEIQRARTLFAESLALQRELEDRAGIAEGLTGFAAVAAAEGQAERAARLLAAATALWEGHGLVMWPAERAEYERTTARARTGLDEATWQRAWDEGRTMTPEQAIAYALEEPADA